MLVQKPDSQVDARIIKNTAKGARLSVGDGQLVLFPELLAAD